MTARRGPWVYCPAITSAFGTNGAATDVPDAPAYGNAAALLLARSPSLSYAQLKDAIMSNVDPLPAFPGKTVSGGRLNVYRALASVSAATAAPASATSSSLAAAASPARKLLAMPDPLLA